MTLHKRDTPDDLIVAELSRDRAEGSAPDLTGAIMTQLGYELTDARTRQRRRRRWLALRCATAAAMLTALLTGYAMHQEHGDVRQASTRSVPDAISQDLLRHQNHLDDVMLMFRDFTVPASLFIADEEDTVFPDDTADPSDAGSRPDSPQGSFQGAPTGAPAGAPPEESGAPAEADEPESSNDASGPYRWV